MGKKTLCIVLAALLTASTLAVAASAAEVEKETSTGTKGTIFFDTGDWNSTKLQFYIWDDTNGMKATKSGWIDGNPWGSQKKLGGTLREDLSGKDGNKGNVFESYEIELESDHVYCVIFNDPDHGQTFDCCLTAEAFGVTADEVWEDYLKFPTEPSYAGTYEENKDKYNEEEAKKVIRPSEGTEKPDPVPTPNPTEPQKGKIFFDTGDWNSTKLQFYIWDDTNGMKATKDGWVDANPWGSNKKLGGTLLTEVSDDMQAKGKVFESYEVELDPTHIYFVIFNDPDHGQTFDCCLSVDALGDIAYRTGNILENPVDSEKTAEEAAFKKSGLGAKLCLTSSGKLQGSTIPVGTNCPGEVATFIFKYLGQKEKISGEDIVTKDIVKKAIEAFGTTADDVWAEYQKHEGEENYQADEAKAVLGLSGSENPDPQPQPIGPALGDVDGDGAITSMDSFVILRVSVGLESYSEDQTKLADVDADGEITSGDAFFVLRRSVGLTTPYAIG